MVAVAGRWVCTLCRERALDDQIPAGRKRFRMSSGVPDYTKWIVVLVVLAVLLRIGVATWLHSAARAPLPRKPNPVPEESEKVPPKRLPDA